MFMNIDSTQDSTDSADQHATRISQINAYENDSQFQVMSRLRDQN